MHPELQTYSTPFPRSILMLGRVADHQEPLMPDEETAISAAVESRRQEFTAGRTIARAAMQHLGIPPRAVPSGKNREPRWPNGVNGSISHSHGICATALSCSESCSVGIDLEQSGRVSIELWSKLFVEEEISLLRQEPSGEQTLTSTILFGAKEAFYKLQFPFTSRFLGFHDVRVEILENRLFIHPLCDLPDFPGIESLHGVWSEPVPGMVLTELWLPGT